MVRTFYDVLDVPQSAEPSEIETAYRERLKETHPDVSEEESATDAVKAVIEAGSVLTDDAERERYDRLGHTNYVAITDAYDPSETQRETTDRPHETSTSSEPGDTGGYSQSSDAGRHSQPEDADGHSHPGDSSAADSSSRDGAGDDPGPSRRRSASAGTVNSANANPDGVAWANSDTANSPAGQERSDRYVASTNERSVLFLAALVAYPILIFATVYSGFLLPFRIVIAACAVVLVMYLVSVPEVSAPAFGLLSLVAGAVIFLADVPIPSAPTVGAAVVTVAPFGLALFAYVLKL